MASHSGRIGSFQSSLATLAVQQKSPIIRFRSALEMLSTFGLQKGGFEQIAMYLAARVEGWSTTSRGEFYNGRDLGARSTPTAP